MLSSPVISSDAQNAFVAETFPQIRAQDMAAFFEAATRRLEPATHETFMVANDNQNELVATLRACKAMLGTFSMHLREAVRSGMLRQTDVLLRIDEWDEDDKMPSLDSYRTMLRSLVEMRPKVRPNLGLSDLGNFLAAWRDDVTSLVFEFFPSDRMSWTISRLDGGHFNRASGSTDVREISTILTAHHGRALIDGGK